MGTGGQGMRQSTLYNVIETTINKYLKSYNDRGKQDRMGLYLGGLQPSLFCGQELLFIRGDE
jgi:hypothetical protein